MSAKLVLNSAACDFRITRDKLHILKIQHDYLFKSKIVNVARAAVKKINFELKFLNQFLHLSAS
jgi:hypothetical protein